MSGPRARVDWVIGGAIFAFAVIALDRQRRAPAAAAPGGWWPPGEPHEPDPQPGPGEPHEPEPYPYPPRDPMGPA